MLRKKQILLVSHCIFNQNTVIEGEARALGAIPSVLSWISKEGYGVVQLPCPEFTYLGLNRPSMTYEQYDTVEYRKHCQKILQPVIDQLLDYQKNHFEIIGILGIQSSPSCDHKRGVFMEELTKLLDKNHIKIGTRWFLPDTSDPVFNANLHVENE